MEVGILAGADRIVVVEQVDGLADGFHEFFFRFGFVLCYAVSHQVGFCFQEMDFGRRHNQHVELVVFPKETFLCDLRESCVAKFVGSL